MNKVVTLLLWGIFFPCLLMGQGRLTGDVQLNADFYDPDDKIGTNTTQYERELSSGEGWMFLNYRMEGLKISTRFDGFYNSPLFDPQEAYSEQGLGFYSIEKDIEDLTLTAGHFYDQFGSGLIFRAFEDRLLGIDNAIQGFRAKYDFSDQFRVKAFMGKQKQRFDTYDAILKGANIEKDFFVSDDLQLYPGLGIVNRTHDDQTMDNIVDEIRSYDDPADRFIPHYNVYTGSIYNQLNYKNVSWYLEYAYKTDEAIRNQAGDRLIGRDGYAIYSSMNYSVSGLGINFEYRKNKFFVLKTTPYADPLRGFINYMPPISKQNARRLTGRYSPQTLDFGEEGYQLDLTYSPNAKDNFNLNLSYIKDGKDKRVISAPIIGVKRLAGEGNIYNPGEKLYHELNFDYYRRWSRKFKTTIGLQTVNYDRPVYQGKPEANMVKTITPYTEITYNLTRRKSLRTELQYLKTDQDLGDFFFGLLEFNVAPKYSISVSDMINVEPRKDGELIDDQSWIHYYNIFGAYTLNQTRFTLGYVKQVEGVVCTGGVCRVEPAFSGLRFGLTTSF